MATRADIEQIYKTVLGRDPDQAGLDYWASQLANVSANQAAQQIAQAAAKMNPSGQSAEIQAAIKNAQAYLSAAVPASSSGIPALPPNTKTFAQGQAEIAANKAAGINTMGGMPGTGVGAAPTPLTPAQQNILNTTRAAGGSPEYFTTTSSGASKYSINDPIANLYRQYAGREPDDEGYAYWKSQFGSTIDPNEISTFRQSANQVLQQEFQQNLPAPLPAGTNETSKIDPMLQPYLQTGLQRAQQLFLTGPGPQLYPEQMYVSPSRQTLDALAQQEQLARAGQPGLEQAQQAYMSSLGQLGETAAGGFLQGSPYRQAAIEAATRPLTQQFQNQIMPSIASQFSAAGRYGSGAMERAQGQATEAYGRALGDIGTGIAYQDYARERALQQQAQGQQAALAQAAPSFFQMGFLPSQALAQVGASREAIEAQPLQERIQRFQYSQQLPYQQLQGYLSSVYGNPMSASQYGQVPQAQANRVGQAAGLGTLGYLAGNMFGGQSFGVPNSTLGAVGGGLLGYFL